MRCSRALRTAGIGAAVMGLALGPLPVALADGPGYGGDAGQLAVTWEAPASAPVVVPSPDSSTTPGAPADAPADAPSAPAADPSTPATTDNAPAPAPSTPQFEPQAAGVAGGGVRGVAAFAALPAAVPAADPKLNPDGLDLVVRGLGFRGRSQVEIRIGSDQPVTARADTAGALAVSLDPERLGGTQPGVSVMAVGRNQSGTQVTLFGSIPPVADGSGPMTLVPWAVASVALAGLAMWVRRRHGLHEQSD